jgi:hypothetical protein
MSWSRFLAKARRFKAMGFTKTERETLLLAIRDINTAAHINHTGGSNAV